MVVQGLDDFFHKQLQLVEKAAVTSTAQLPLNSEKTADRSPIGGVRQSISGFYWNPGKWRFQTKFYKGKKSGKKSIYLQGDDADCMYFVESGMASVRIHNQVSFTT